MGILAVILIALVTGAAWLLPAGYWPVAEDETAAGQGRSMIQYSRLEFARAIERAIRGD